METSGVEDLGDMNIHTNTWETQAHMNGKVQHVIWNVMSRAAACNSSVWETTESTSEASASHNAICNRQSIIKLFKHVDAENQGIIVLK